MEINLGKIKKILIIRTDRLGEFILSLPVIKAIRNKFPSAYICFMVNPVIKEIIEDNPDINEIMVYDETTSSGFLKSIKLIWEIRKEKFDLAIILNPKKKFNIITFIANIRVRLGYNRKWGFLLTHKIEDKKFLGQKHEIEYNFDLLHRIGIDSEDRSLFVRINEDDARAVYYLLNGYGVLKTDFLIAIHPWTSDYVKQWPLKNFSNLAKRLINEFLYKVIIIGGKEEVEQSKNFCEFNIHLINLTGKLNLRQLAAFFQRCNCLISNDSGPIHMASAVGIPVVAIFRNDIPSKGSIRWGPTSRGSIIVEKPNLSDITVEDVFEKVKEMLKR